MMHTLLTANNKISDLAESFRKLMNDHINPRTWDSPRPQTQQGYDYRNDTLFDILLSSVSEIMRGRGDCTHDPLVQQLRKDVGVRLHRKMLA